MLKADNDNRLNKKKYKKPSLRIIELSAEEVLAVGCKIQAPNQFAPGQPACGILANCSAQGT
jgi:hypothetical protein